ncbi:ferredoxin [Streptomyces sp. P38-E01]|uniref:Ferredoxin n=1 Tax=Streptomyces tardus TaxID=2780544 RepID=A0A949JK10_9ACTN|nr:ferredoxin [Streptomyces tardus]MBU7600223.1 ferredoxin [Streptomyces tardus]
MKVTVEEDRCCGAGSCVLVAPEVFDQREDDGIVLVLDERPPAERHRAVREAVAVCPTSTISVAEVAR